MKLLARDVLKTRVFSLSELTSIYDKEKESMPEIMNKNTWLYILGGW